MIFFGGVNWRDFCKTCFFGPCYSSDDVRIVFAMGRYNRFEFWDEGRSLGCSVFWDGPKRGCLAVVRQTSGCAADFLSKLFQTGVFSWEKFSYSTFQCLSSVLRSLI